MKHSVTQTASHGDTVSVSSLLSNEKAQIYSELLARILEIMAIKGQKKVILGGQWPWLLVEVVFKHFLKHIQQVGGSSLVSKVAQLLLPEITGGYFLHY